MCGFRTKGEQNGQTQPWTLGPKTREIPTHRREKMAVKPPPFRLTVKAEVPVVQWETSPSPLNVTVNGQPGWLVWLRRPPAPAAVWPLWIDVPLCIHACSPFSSVTQLCPTLCDYMDLSMPGFPGHHQLPELAQMHVHRAGDHHYKV